MVSWLHN